MNYPGLSSTLKKQLSVSEWTIIQEDIEKVDKLSWFENDKACELLENAAKKAMEKALYKCAARVLYYYEKFFAQ